MSYKVFGDIPLGDVCVELTQLPIIIVRYNGVANTIDIDTVEQILELDISFEERSDAYSFLNYIYPGRDRNSNIDIFILYEH